VNNFLPPCYRTSSGTPKATIRILSGTTISESIVIDGLDLSWISIVSDATTVQVNLSSGSFILGKNGAKLPIIRTNLSIRISDSGYSGIVLQSGAEAYLDAGKQIALSYLGYAVIKLEGGSILRGNINTTLLGSSDAWVSYVLYVSDSIVILPQAYLDNAYTLVGGRNSFIRLLGATFGSTCNHTVFEERCDCIPRS
jgi:hypothetical protein